MGRLLIIIIRLYQRLISPMLGANCRFYPSCSNYAIEAIRVHGWFIGTGYTVWRILRCQPYCEGGWDPVPPRKTS